MAKAFWTVRLPLSGELVNIAVDAEDVHKHKAPFSATVTRGKSMTKVDENSALALPGFQVSVFGRKLTVATQAWHMTATANSFPFASLNKNKVLLDVEAQPLYAPLVLAAAPPAMPPSCECCT